MARQTRVAPETEQLWQEFHDLVNVTSDQLRTWLLTEGSGEEAFGADPDLALPEPGRQVLLLLGKRKVDLTRPDLEVMEATVAAIRSLLDARPPEGPDDDEWRRALLDLGHDPLRAT
ncbi:MAG TPA: DUF3140 domain-containing protein [Micromonospora sp.]